MRQRYLSLLLSFLLLPVLLHAATEGHFDRTLSVSGSVNLDLVTGSGDVAIKTGNANQVVVQATIQGNGWFFGGGNDNAIHQVESNPPIQQSGNNIKIGYNLPEDAKRHVSISYTITVPPNTVVAAHSGSGNVEVDGVHSAVQAQTGSGDIRARDLGGRVDLVTGSGSIRAENVAAPFTAQTGSGDIEASLSGPGDVDVHNGSGNITIRGVKGDARARTGSGNIEVDGDVTGPWQLQSGSGNVRVATGPKSSFNLNARTSSGSIHSDLNVTVQGSMTDHELRGSVRGGGPEVEISTSSGDIQIR